MPGTHRMQTDLQYGDFLSEGKIFPIEGVVKESEAGYLHAWGAATPSDGQAGFAPGCLFVNHTTKTLYQNFGTLASCQFVLIGGATAGIPRSIAYVIPGVDFLDRHVHFNIEIDSARDFSDPIVDAESKDDQTGWYFNSNEGDANDGTFQAVPSAGLLAYYDWEQDDKGQWDYTRQEYAGYEVIYEIATGTSLVRGTLYYYRIRQYDVEAAEYGDWQLGSFRA